MSRHAQALPTVVYPTSGGAEPEYFKLLQHNAENSALQEYDFVQDLGQPALKSLTYKYFSPFQIKVPDQK